VAWAALARLPEDATGLRAAAMLGARGSLSLNHEFSRLAEIPGVFGAGCRQSPSGAA
jgi:hypothetical protein